MSKPSVWIISEMIPNGYDDVIIQPREVHEVYQVAMATAMKWNQDFRAAMSLQDLPSQNWEDAFDGIFSLENYISTSELLRDEVVLELADFISSCPSESKYYSMTMRRLIREFKVMNYPKGRWSTRKVADAIISRMTYNRFAVTEVDFIPANNHQKIMKALEK